jgi:drug/metabolite transporter (DMT)-like permease
MTLLAIAASRRGRCELKTWIGSVHRLHLFFLRGFCGCTALMCLFYGLQHVPLADATAINYLGIPLTAVVGALMLGDPFGAVDAACMVCCSVGVVIVIQPPSLFGSASTERKYEPLPFTPVCVLVLGALFAAIALCLVRKIGPNEASQ